MPSFGLIRAEGLWLAVPLAGLAIFATSFARVYGQGGLQVGNLTSVVIVLALDTPLHSLSAAAGQGLGFFAGAGWASLLTLVIWHIHPYAPARAALAEVSLKLGLLARDLAELANAEASLAAFEAHAANHRRGVREAIENARAVALQTFSRRGVLSRRAAQLAVRLQALEQVFAALIACSEIFEHAPAERPPAARAIRLVAGWLAALGPDIVADRPLDTAKKQASLRRLTTELQKLPAASALRHALEAIAERLAILITASAPPGEAASDAQAQLPLRDKILIPIRANLTWQSAPMRHALRAAVTVVPLLAWTLSRHQTFAHWAAITAVLCLQPYFSATWSRAAERIAGTACGGVVAALIGMVAQTRIELALAMFPLTIFAFAIRGVSFGAFTAALTPMIVLLVEQIAPGANELAIAISRVGYTLLGGGVAIAAGLFLWPGFEGGRLDASIAAAIAAHAAYAKAAFATLLDNAATPDAARRAAGLASNNLEAALSRALYEPHRRRDPAIERGAVVDAALRRMAGRLSLMVLDRPAITPGALPLWRQWQDWLVRTLSATATARPPLPPGPGTDALTRLARQAELIAK